MLNPVLATVGLGQWWGKVGQNSQLRELCGSVVGGLLWHPWSHVVCVPPGAVPHPAQFLPRQLSFYQGERRTAPGPRTAHKPPLGDTRCSPEPAHPATHALQAPLPSWAPCPFCPAASLWTCSSAVPFPPLLQQDEHSQEGPLTCSLSVPPGGGSLLSDPLMKLGLEDSSPGGFAQQEWPGHPEFQN